MPDRRPSRTRAAFRAAAVSHSKIGPEGLLLVALSVADLLVTYLLLSRGGGFFEANPVARYVFERWNIAGMTTFKFGVIGFVFVLAEIIDRHRPGAGRGVVTLGCVAATAVVAHGLRLLLGTD